MIRPPVPISGQVDYMYLPTHLGSYSSLVILQPLPISHTTTTTAIAIAIAIATATATAV